MALTRRKRDDTAPATVKEAEHDTGRDTRHDTRQDARRDPARETFGGVNLGAAVFGWLVAVAVGVILTSVIGALVTGPRRSQALQWSE